MTHRVLFFSDVAYFKGGAEKSLFDLLGNPAVEPLLLVPSEGTMAEEARRRKIAVEVMDLGGVETIRRPLRPLRLAALLPDIVGAAVSLKRLARRHGVLCIHSNGLKAHGLAVIARLLGGPPLIAHIRAIPFTRAEKAFWQLLRLVAARIVLVSRPCWHGATLPRNCRVIHNGIVPPWDELPPRTVHRPLRVGFAGRLQHTKNVELLIDWFAYAREQGMDATLTIRGEAQPDEKSYAEMLKAQVRRLGLEGFCFFEGRVDGLEKIYAGIDVNVVPSKTPDPLPRSVMEAMAVGLPVIGYPAGGIPDMIIDGETGFLVSDAQSFVAALERLTGDQQRYDLIRRKAFDHILGNFSRDRLHREISNEYDAIAGAPQRMKP